MNWQYLLLAVPLSPYLWMTIQWVRDWFAERRMYAEYYAAHPDVPRNTPRYNPPMDWAPWPIGIK